MRASTAVLAALLAALAIAPGPAAHASCAAPYLDEVGDLVRGEVVSVQGHFFFDGCQDTVTCTEWLGCSACRPDDPAPHPYEDVALRLEQGGTTWDLGVTDDASGETTWTVRVPVGANPGPATLVADHAEPLEVRIR